MSAEGFGYTPTPNIFPPPSMQIPLQNSASTFNPYAPSFVSQPLSPTLPNPSPDHAQHAVSDRKDPIRDDRVQPSLESGGVPDPSPTYLVHASLPPLLLPHPRKILVVIDLNGTLLFRPKRRKGSLFIERPHARRFLSYCIETFFVAIWSSATPNNVRNMCEQLISPDQLSKVVALWGRDRFGLTQKDYNQRVQCYKRLTKLWDAPRVAKSHPNYATGGRWSQADTVLIDDSPEKARAEPYNLVSIPEFGGDTNEPSDILPQVHDYINKCSRQADISTYIHASPFQPREDFRMRKAAV